jgi:hypothetical protein
MKVFYYFISFICLFNKYNSKIMYFSNLCFNKYYKNIFELVFYNKNKFEGITKFESTNNIYLIENLLNIDKKVENYENLIIFFYTNSDFKYLYKINKFNYIIIGKNYIDDLEIISNKYYLFTIEESRELYDYIENKNKTATINFFKKNLKNGNKIFIYNLFFSIIIFIILFVLIKCIQCRNDFFIYKILKSLNYMFILVVFGNYIQNGASFFLIYSMYKSVILSMFIFIILGYNIIYFNNLEIHFGKFLYILLIEYFYEIILFILDIKEIYLFENLLRNIKLFFEYFSLLIIIFYSLFKKYLLLKIFYKINKNYNFYNFKALEIKSFLFKKILLISFFYCLIGFYEIYSENLLNNYFYFKYKFMVGMLNIGFILNKDCIFIFFIIKIFYINNYPENFFDDLNLNYKFEMFYLKLNEQNIINENNLNNIKNKNNPLVIINPNFQNEIFNVLNLGYIYEEIINEKKIKKHSQNKKLNYINLEFE